MFFELTCFNWHLREHFGSHFVSLKPKPIHAPVSVLSCLWLKTDGYHLFWSKVLLQTNPCTYYVTSNCELHGWVFVVLQLFSTLRHGFGCQYRHLWRSHFWHQKVKKAQRSSACQLWYSHMACGLATPLIVLHALILLPMVTVTVLCFVSPAPLLFKKAISVCIFLLTIIWMCEYVYILAGGECYEVECATIWYVNLNFVCNLVLNDSCSGSGAFRWVTINGSLSWSWRKMQVGTSCFWW